MDRYLLRTAAIVVCAAWAAGCGTAQADKANASAQPAQPGDAASAPTPGANTYPVTLEGEIAHAHQLRVSGSYDDAAKVLGQLMLVAPDDARVVGEYGKVLVQQGRPDGAVPFLERAIQLSANDWTLYSALGVAYDQLDEHTKAHAAYDHALALKPGQPDVLNNYAVSRMLGGDLAAAQKMLKQASQPSGGDQKINNNLALLDSMKREPATGAPKPLAVVQPAPADPKAGPRHQKPSKLAQAAPHKQPDAPELRQQDEPAPTTRPALRTAADGQ